MIRRIFAFLVALAVLFCTMAAFAEDDDDEDDEDWMDDEDEELLEDFDEEENKVDFRTMGYDVETFDDGDFCFRLTDDKKSAILISYTGDDPVAVFPETVSHPPEVPEPVPVVAIDNCMSQSNLVIETVQIPGTISVIGNLAFATCPKLKNVILAEGICELGKSCFGGCEELEEISLPESVEVIPLGAFANCPQLREVSCGANLKTIEFRAFYMCPVLTKVRIPDKDSVEIDPNAFEECSPDVQIVTE